MNDGLKLLGDWNAKIHTTLQDSLSVSVDVMGRTGEEACRHALILMAQSARAMAPKAPARRPVTVNPKFRHLLPHAATLRMREAGQDVSPYFKLTATRLGQRGDTALYANEKARIAKIGRRGLLKRSWMWGLAAMGASGDTGNAIPGTSAVYGLIEGNMAGYVKENRLAYAAKAMPSGWETEVEQRAGNKIMAQARVKLQNAWVGAVQRGGRANAERALSDFFITGAVV
jgi:hypothetical protein